MVANGYGKVLNIGSTGSYTACPNNAVYGATKAHILSLSQGVNAELKRTGVSVTVLCPGSTHTEFARKANMDDTLLFNFFVMEPEKVAAVGYKALMQRRQSVVAGLYNNLLVFSSKIIPSALLNPIIENMLAKP